MSVPPRDPVVRRYAASEWKATPFGFAGPDTAGFAKAREAVYGRFFGEVESVSHELLPLIPHVDVCTYRRSGKDGRKVATLVTSGMSDLPMPVPEGADVPKRVELIFYCVEFKDEYAETLRWLAHFPHSQKTWIGYGHTVPNGNPPAPFWGSKVLDTILFVPPIVQRDQTLPDELALAGDPVHFLWVVPLTTAECELKLAKWLEAIFGLFDRHRHPHVFDPHRASYV
jgi:hypothetical protein